MSAEPVLREDLDDEAQIAADDAADDAAMAAVARGEYVSNQAVRDWIGSWRTDRELPRPQAGD